MSVCVWVCDSACVNVRAYYMRVRMSVYMHARVHACEHECNDRGDKDPGVRVLRRINTHIPNLEDTLRYT